MPGMHMYAPTLESLFGDPNHLDRELILHRLHQVDQLLWSHASVVAQWTGAVADAVGLDQAEQSRVVDAAWLHDLGKLTISNAIVGKPGPLDESEWAEIRLHPGRGADFLSACPSYSSVAPLVRAHHEWFDGSGYPGGLSSEAIPLGSRIIGIVDAFDAMTSHRPYRSALTIEEARDEMYRFSGSQFDPAIVGVLLSLTGNDMETRTR